MAFVKEYPVSQALLERFDWTALPLLYQGEAGMYCQVPLQVFVDYENDLVYCGGGGGSGRTTRIIQPRTEVLYFKGIPIRFVSEVTDSKKHKDEKTGLFVFDWMEVTIVRIVAPISLRTYESRLLEAIDVASKASLYGSTFAIPKDVSVKISTKVEYI